MSVKYRGSCLCGAVSYQSDAEPRYSFNCHCRDCQKQQVRPMHQLLFHQSELKISGELKYFETLGSSGRPIKELLPDLWFSTFGLPELVPEMISIRAGTLDDPSLYHPKAEVL